jgi:murein DD-endopeptidase MepM/ murein hydrolase activator NlpD
LNSRVRVMYESGDVSFWEVLFAATDFADFLDRFRALTLIVERDKKLVDSIRKDQEALRKDREEWERQQQARRAKQEELMALEAVLQARYKEKRTELTEKEREIAEAEASLVRTYESTAQLPEFLGDGKGNGTYVWPVPSSRVITSGYGYRGAEFHKGIDIGAPIGTPIVAVADGVVLQSGPASGYGHWIVILHEGGVMSVYGHMYAHQLKVGVGERVKQGQVIASVGNDGRSSGPHLHFSIARGTSAGAMNYVNPMAFLQ